MKMLKYLWLGCLLLTFGSCESLEDTYSDYAEGGALRYLGKCRDLKIEPGWKRLIVSWENHVDPMIDKIRVSWTADGISQDTILDKNATSLDIYNLENKTYEVSVCSMDKNGKTSLSITDYMRPYTAEHENVLAFTKIVNKHFFLKNRLVLFFDNWQGNVVSAVLKYTSGGQLKELQLDSAFVTDNAYFLLPDVLEPNTAVTVERSGRLEGCDDLVVFDPHELTHGRVYTAGFRELIREKYGITDITDEFVNSLTSLDIDYNIETFEDIMHLSSLKTLRLGANRYMNDKYLFSIGADSEVEQLERSMFALKVANEVYGLEIQHYNDLYFPEGEYAFVKEMGNPEIKEKEYLIADNWKYTWSASDPDDDLQVDVLFDKDSEVGWEVRRHRAPVITHEIIVDLQNVKSLNGMKITQKDVSPGTKQHGILANSIKIKLSMDEAVWENATYVENNKLGATSREVTFIDFPEQKRARYVKLIVEERPYGNTQYAVSLGKVRLY